MGRRQQAGKAGSAIPLRQPTRDGPSDQTLLELAQERQLFQQAQKRQSFLDRQTHAPAETELDGGDAQPGVTRIVDSALWAISLAMLHFTLDVLVQHQYAVALAWRSVMVRTAGAFAGGLFLF
jgi:hypothetical protein